MTSLTSAVYFACCAYLLVLLNSVDAVVDVSKLSYDSVEFSKHKYDKYDDNRGKHGKYWKKYNRQQVGGGFEDERIIGDSVNVSPYLGPHVPGQDERDELTVRDQHQQLTIALVVLGILLGMSCIPMCFILWCCIITGRRVRKMKLEELQKEFDFDSATLYAPTY